MNTTDLKTHIAAAVAVRWDDFATKHPMLAGVIDQTLLIENVSDALANDPEYQAAVAVTRTAEAGVTALVGLIDGYVVKFIGRLI